MMISKYRSGFESLKSKNVRPIFKIVAAFDALINSLKYNRVSFSGDERFSDHLGKIGEGHFRTPPPSTARVNRGKAFFGSAPEPQI